MWQSCTETKVDRKMMPNLKTIFDKNGLSVSGAVRPTLITAFAFFYNTDSSLMFTGCWSRVCPSKYLCYHTRFNALNMAYGWFLLLIIIWYFYVRFFHWIIFSNVHCSVEKGAAKQRTQHILEHQK